MNPDGGRLAPGAWEWLSGLSATALIGYQSTLIQSAARPHTGFRYYVEAHQTLWIHQVALGFNLLILLLVLLGFLARGWLPNFRRVMCGAMGLGVVLVWYEIVKLSQLPPTPTYAFGQLPYVPVNNLGILGAQVFLTILIAAAPLRGLPPVHVFGIKAALAIGVFLTQLVVWESFLA